MIKFHKIFFFTLSAIISTFLVVQNSGCAKEYSNEGGDSTLTIYDSILIPLDSGTQLYDTIKVLPDCASCIFNDSLKLGNWNFGTGNSYVCGTTTNSGFFGGNTKKDITFFGPSACSVDTGIVVSAFFSVPLDHDRFNIISNRAAFYYYDNNAAKDILISKQEKVFMVTIESFIYTTGIATGTFSGTVFKTNGDTAYIKEGKFKVHIK